MESYLNRGVYARIRFAVRRIKMHTLNNNNYKFTSRPSSSSSLGTSLHSTCTWDISYSRGRVKVVRLAGESHVWKQNGIVRFLPYLSPGASSQSPSAERDTSRRPTPCGDAEIASAKYRSVAYVCPRCYHLYIHISVRTVDAEYAVAPSTGLVIINII
jgi:hypothetical protein